MFIKHRFASPFQCLPPILMLVLALGACAKVQPEPFAKFSTSVQELRSGTDNAASLIGTWSEARAVEELAILPMKEAGETLLKMRLRPRDEQTGTFDPATVTGEVELPYMRIESFRHGLHEFNSALVEYAKAMQALASPDLVSTAAFDAMRTELNSNLKQAAKSFGVEQVSIGSGSFKVDGFALFSTISTEAMRMILENKRKTKLISLIKENQLQIDAVSKLGMTGINNLGDALNREYDVTFGSILRQMSDIGSDKIYTSEASKKARTTVVEQLISLNKRYINELKVLDALRTAYSKLPEANQELANNLENPTSPLSAIIDIYNEALRIYTSYEVLRNANLPQN